jgi:putative toxin-antitoxin system antitoxin component (TIGR02293 family)
LRIIIVVTIASVVSLWEVSHTLGCSTAGDEALIPVLRHGLPFSALEKTMEAFRLTREEITQILAIPQRTLIRRKQQKRLTADESDRLFRLTRVMAHAEQVFEDRAKAAEWFHRPNRALKGEVPLYLMDTDIGTTQVDDVLGRIEHGVFS